MKVLYLVKNHFVLSESYIFGEQKFMASQGVEIESYSVKDPITLTEKVAAWKPDLIHVHWLTIAYEYSRELSALGIPVTIRGHSFDATPSNIEGCARVDVVRKIWLFPHIARKHPLEKVESLYAFHDLPVFQAGEIVKNMVMRAGAGLPGKGWDSMLHLAGLMPEMNFLFVATHAKNDPAWVDKNVEPYLPPNTMLKTDLSHEVTCLLTGQAGFYVRGAGEAHEWSMPVSALEAMASGCITFVPDLPHAQEYLGGGAFYFGDMQEVASKIRKMMLLPDEEFGRRRDASVNAVSQYSMGEILPKVLSEWRSLIRENEKAPLG